MAPVYQGGKQDAGKDAGKVKIRKPVLVNSPHPSQFRSPAQAADAAVRDSRPYSMVLDEPVASNIQSGSGQNQFPAAVQAATLVERNTIQPMDIDNEDLTQREPTLEQMAASRLNMSPIVLQNGDVLQGGFLFPLTSQIASGYTPLQPYLEERLMVMHPPVPIRCFDRTWLALDQAKWMRPRTEAEKKKAKLAPNSDLPQDLLMEYVEFNDLVDLFIEYVALHGWTKHAERFGELKYRTIALKRSTNCWMLALRYFLKVLEGVMTPSTDKIIANAGELQVILLEEAKTVVENFSERSAGVKNPYVPGGKKEHLSPITGQPKVEDSTTAKPAPTPTTTDTPVAAPNPVADNSANNDNNRNANRGNRRPNRGGRGGRGGRNNYRGNNNRGGNQRSDSNRDSYRDRDERSRSPPRRQFDRYDRNDRYRQDSPRARRRGGRDN